MRLQKLTIEREKWGENKGMLEGAVKFADGKKEISIILDPGLSQAVLEICADKLIESAKSAAEMMVRDVIEQANPATALTDETA